ncbi:TonB-dependent receptor domain-containing protein [Brucellaceae bacterium C25G]
MRINAFDNDRAAKKQVCGYVGTPSVSFIKDQKKHIMTGFLAALLSGTAVLSFSLLDSAYAQSAAQTVEVNIPAQSLANALISFSRQTKIEILITTDLAAGRRSSPVSGSMSSYSALNQVLAGTGLTYRSTNANTVTIIDPSMQAAVSADEPGSIVLNTIEVSGGSQIIGGDASYETAAPVSSTTGEELQTRFGGDVNQALRNTAGTYSRQSNSQPAYAVNIRGMSGYGRVNNMIDGVPQTFRNAAGHGAYGGTYLYLHPEFISGLDITRGVVSGAHGSGTLSGAADFKSITVNDVLEPGETAGGITRWKTGSNGYNWAGMAAAGMRHSMFEDGSGEINFIGAWAKSSNGNYRNGDGYYATPKYDPNTGLQISGIVPAENSPLSGLAKVEFIPDDNHRLNLGYVRYENRFLNNSYDWSIDNNTYYLNYAYTPDNDLVDARLNLYYNKTDMEYLKGTEGGYVGRTTRALGWGGDVSNTSRFNLSDDLNLKLFYGASYNVDDYSVTYRGANAPGTLKKTSVFSDATLSWGIFDLVGGLRYDRFDLSGVRQARQQGTGAGWLEECPASRDYNYCPEEDVSRDGDSWNPKVSLVSKPLDWLQLYATYAHTFRPPTAQEVFWGLVPFNDDEGAGIFNNLGLLPERSKGWDIGFNIAQDNVFRDDDHLRLKVGYFRNSISNFITNDLVSIDRCPANQTCYMDTAVWVNVPGSTIMNGIELQGGYDTGAAYVNFSYTKSKTDLPYGWGVGSDMGNGDIDVLPDDYGMLDFGIRLLEQRLNLGAKLRYTSKSGVRTVVDGEYHSIPAYTLFDLYGSYNFNDYSRAFFSVENVTNKAYGLARSGDGLAGRGRTFIAGFQTKLGYSEKGFSGGFWNILREEKGSAPNVFDWSGAYVGISAGHSWTPAKADFSFSSPVAHDAHISTDIDGFSGGVYAGYNQQFRNDIVLGVEADINLSSARAGPDKFYSYFKSNRDYIENSIVSHQDWAAALRVRAGMAVDRYLPYVTAGVSVAGYKHDKAYEFERGVLTNTVSEPFGGGRDTVVGFTVGAGLEHALTDQLILRTDYRFTEQAHKKNFISNGVKYKTDTGNRHDLRMGFTYKF